MLSFPPCKINLGLRIISKRHDGFHNIETCFYPVPWTDMLEIIPAQKNSFDITGLTIPGNQESNLCLRARQLLKTEHPSITPVAVHLHKIIPTGAGLGGGSSDGAWTLRMLNDIFELQLSQAQLTTYASRLGSDCATFLYDGPTIGKGKGDELTPVDIDLKGWWLALVTPDVHVSTVDAYSKVTPRAYDGDLQTIVHLPPQKWKDQLTNDFEKSVFSAHPVLGAIKQQLYDSGAVYASMSGSGSTVYGLFDRQPDLNGAKLFRLN